MKRNEIGVQLTDEDLETIRRCRKLSFWQGSVPLTVACVCALRVTQHFGYLNTMRTPAYILAVVFGYIGGKVFYVGKCKRMFLALRDSRIKDQLLNSDTFGLESDGTSPLIVTTPVTPENRDSKPPTTYAERRDYYRMHPNDARSSVPGIPEQTPLAEPEPKLEQRHPSFFTEDRPSGSYQFDDIYTPRD
ncbi:OCIA domain-containing protein 1 [Clonorchis sinensis]|uniref:OCIA domain-containing protein 1 n=1 Tax=Clonorchis sinensis TaxID=79923 RepID=A0A3R7D0L8_CLOSI|nr:OCIA domain-containing protein 1 [Clonorchis sinensis]